MYRGTLLLNMLPAPSAAGVLSQESLDKPLKRLSSGSLNFPRLVKLERSPACHGLPDGLIWQL